MPTTARSHADDLRARSDAQLAQLVRLRPDLARPVPADVSALAARAATRPSTQRALEQLDARLLHTLEAVLIAGRSGAAAADLLGSTEQDLAEPLQQLWESGLLWRSPEGLRAARAVGESLTHPAGLGPTAAEVEVRLPADLPGAIAALEPSPRQVLERLTWGVPRAQFGGSLAQVRDDLVAAGLLHRLDGQEAVVPREVGIALRGGRLHQNPLSAPELTIQHRPHGDVDTSAGAEALRLLSAVEELMGVWEHQPPRVLRSGGLSVKDHKQAARLIDDSPELSAFVIELAAAAGLLANDEQAEPSWLPTAAYDDWVQQSPAARWAALLHTWWTMSRAPFLIGTSHDGKAVNVLSDAVSWPVMRTRRRDVVAALAELPPQAATPLTDLEEHLRWRRPLRLPAGAPTRAEEVLQEAAWLGVTGRGALSAAGRLLLTHDRESDLASALMPFLPSPVDHVLVQGDLTAIAPGPLTDDLARFMHTTAETESRGGATVYRFTPTSVRRALDTGMSADAVRTRIAQASATGLPQALDYLIGDVARRHGRTRLGSAGSYVRSDDEAALGALLADRELAALQLRQIAPTVLVSPVAARVALELLREHAVVVETSDGGLVITATTGARAATRATLTARPVTVDRLDDDAARTLIAQLRQRQSQDDQARAERVGPDIPSTDATVAVTMLQDAAAERAAVWLGYVDELGSPRRALFHPERVQGGRAMGTVDGSLSRRTFVIHRITGVATVD